MLTRSLADIYARGPLPPDASNPLGMTNVARNSVRDGARVAVQSPAVAAARNLMAAQFGVGGGATIQQAMPQPGAQQMTAAPVPGLANTPSQDTRIAPPSAQSPGLMAQQPGVQVQPIGASNPNQQQLSPQAQALFAELQRRADLAKTQAGQLQLKTQDNGVFSGGQKAPQSAGTPQMSLPQLYAGGR